MSATTNHRNLLRNYLLGRLNAAGQEEQRELAESFYENDEQYVELTSVEDELLDQYVRGELSTDDRDGFASYLAHLPEETAREKVVFAQALIQVAAEHNQFTQPENVLPDVVTARTVRPSEPTTRWHRFWPGFLPTFSKPQLWGYSFVAMILLLGGALAWLYIYGLWQTNKQLMISLDRRTREQQESQQAIQSLRQQSAAEREQLLAEVGHLREENEAQARQIAEHRSASIPSPLLSDGNERRGRRPEDTIQTPTKIKLKTGALSFQLNLRLPADERFQLIEARLTDTGAQKEVWKLVCDPVCAPAIANRILRLQLPAGHLGSGQHRLSLQLRAPDGLIVPQGYNFILIK